VEVQTTGSLDMSDGSVIGTESNGFLSSGNAGNVTVAADSIFMKNSTIGTMTDTGVIGNSGNVEVHTGSLDMREGSGIGNALGDYSFGNAGNVTVTANSILMTGAYDSKAPTGLYSLTGSQSVGRGGDISISIKTGSLEVRDGASIITSTYGWGAGGNVDINAKSILVSGQNAKRRAAIATWSYFAGNSGDIRINSGNLEVRNGYISTSAGLSGKAGDLEVKADQILLTEGAGLIADGHIGDGGNIWIKTNSLEMTDGAQIMSNTDSSGTCGNIKVKANSILLSGVDTGGNQSAISSSVVSELATGAGGDIKIKAQTLEVKEGATISAATIGRGDGGKIEVNAESVLISGKTKDGYTSSLITSSTSSGKAGDIQIKTHNLEINDDGYIDASTYVSENAGNISIKAPWITLANGGSISAGTTGSGTGGSIQLSGNHIQLINGAFIDTASVEGATGNAGNIDISAENTLQMKNSFISTAAGQSDGGNIQIKAGYMVELIDSKIVASVKGGPQTTGGNITIDPQYVILNDSQINSKATEGKGGRIQINADVFLASPESKVDAHSDLGINGTVDIRAPITNISGTLAPMQGNFLSAEALLRDRCAARIRGEKSSSFVVKGRDGLPIRPGSVLPSPIY
jgi:large exoprotein involved in heme utilization and adhesion